MVKNNILKSLSQIVTQQWYAEWGDRQVTLDQLLEKLAEYDRVKQRHEQTQILLPMTISSSIAAILTSLVIHMVASSSGKNMRIKMFTIIIANINKRIILFHDFLA